MRILALLRLVTGSMFICGGALHAVPLSGNVISANDTYTVKTIPGHRYIFSVSGNFGGGSLAIKWNDGTSATAFGESPATAAETWGFSAPTAQVDLVLTGATAPSLTLGIVPAPTNILADPSAAFAALGLGTAATEDSTYFGQATDVQKIRERVCATRAAFAATATTPGTASQTATSVMEVKLTDNATDLKFVWNNCPDGVTTIVKASATIGGVIHPIYFNGARTSSVASGGILISDALGIYQTKGTLITVRTYADAGTGINLKGNTGNFFSNSSNGIIYNSDVTAGGAFTQASVFCFGVSAVIGKCSNPCLLIVGDSIISGISSTGATSNIGWPKEAFGGTLTESYHAGSSINILSISVGGEAAQNWTLNMWRSRLMNYCDVAIVALGTNDMNLGSSAAVLAALQVVYTDIASRGIPVWASTIPPRSSSTDGWVTTANQTAVSLTIIAGTNAALRAIPTPLVGCIDVSTIVSTAQDSGIWKAAYTTDGIHPKDQAIIRLMSAAIPANLMTP